MRRCGAFAFLTPGGASLLPGVSVIGLALTGQISAQAVIGPRPDYAPVVAAVERLIAHEMADKRIPAISIALVDDSETVWATGFGMARARDSVPATAETVYRAGSVSKIFTALAVMRLVEQGRVALDTPVTTYLPEFTPRDPFGQPITLRHLLAHHAGLVREPAVGSYFDSTAPSLAATVASLNATTLVYPPGTRLKYSNAGMAVVGSVIERVTGASFADFVRREVLQPLGVVQSDFVRTAEIAARIAESIMWTVDGRRFAAPTFGFGMAPAVGLYTTVTDLARLLTASFAADRSPAELAAGGGGTESARPALLSRDAWEEMWTPQFADPASRAGMGLGFFVSQLDGRRRVWHDGAVYGFGTQFAALPDERVGVVVAGTLDGAGAVMDRIAAYALRAMLAQRTGTAMPPLPITEPVPAAVAARMAGRYVGDGRDVRLRRRGDRLLLVPAPGRSPVVLGARGDTLVVDDPRETGVRLLMADSNLVVFGDTLRRATESRPDTAPARLRPFIGEYGWDHNTLYIYEDQGRLFALIQWFYAYLLTPISDTAFAFPQTGLYPGELAIFRKEGTSVQAGNVTFPRRRVGPAAGGQLRLQPTASVPDLLRAALGAAPPVDTAATRTPELVDLADLDRTIHLDIRYATTNNFLGSVFYSSARAFLQRPAAAALLRAHRKLREQGYGLLIHDAYRPWYVTKTFWDATPPASRWLVADPTRGSRHNRGSAVDLTLYSLATGKPIEMVGTYDEATDRSMPDYPGGTALQRWHRGLLRGAMEGEGFSINSEEWWHFDYRDWHLYPILNQRFDDLKR